MMVLVVTMFGDLHSVVYASAATPAFDADRLAEFVAACKARNRPRELTGILLYRDGRFLQVLEGRPDEVRSMMARITVDPRHEDVRILLDEPIDVRRFPTWDMGLLRLEDAVVDVPAGYRRAFDDIAADRSGDEAHVALDDLLEWCEARAA